MAIDTYAVEDARGDLVAFICGDCATDAQIAQGRILFGGGESDTPNTCDACYRDLGNELTGDAGYRDDTGTFVLCDQETPETDQ